MSNFAVLLCFLTLAAVAGARLLQLPSSRDASKRPLIGILSQPGDGDSRQYINHLAPDDPRRENISYIAASYVKFVEAGGARAVPLIYNEPEESLRKKFSAINGVIFPGGNAAFDGQFYKSAELLFKLAVEANDKGDYFPVFGTCLGLELLLVIVCQNHSILEHFNAMSAPAPLILTGDWAKKQSLFTAFSEGLLEKIQHQNLAMENHVHGISPATWSKNEMLTDFFQVLSTSLDLDGKAYVSTVQARNYPITGVQWHPEKNAFEWGLPSIPHTEDAVQVTHSVASFLVSQARQSSHVASRQEEDSLLIYNYSPIFSGKDGTGHFDQSYVFW